MDKKNTRAATSVLAEVWLVQLASPSNPFASLIDIPPRIERVLRYYMRQYPEDPAGVEKVLRRGV